MRREASEFWLGEVFGKEGEEPGERRRWVTGRDEENITMYQV